MPLARARCTFSLQRMYGLEQRLHIKVGLVALVAVVLLLLGITIGRGINISTAPVQVSIRAANAAGLESGAPVWINGIKHGTVLSVRPDGDSVLIVAGIDDGSMLRADASAQIAMLELTGGKRLDILPGTSSQRWNGAVLPAKPSSDVSQMLSTLATVGGRLEQLLVRLDTTVTAANALLADQTLQARLRELVEQTAALASDLHSLVRENRQSLEHAISSIDQTSSDLRQMLQENRPTVERLLAQLEQLSTSLEKTRSNADRLLLRADSTLAEISSALATLRQQRSVLGKLLYDEGFASQMEDALRRIAGLVDTISRFGVNVNVRLGTRP